MSAVTKAELRHMLNQGRVRLVGASDTGLKGELYDVLKEFFTDSWSWLEAIPVAIVPATLTYAVTPAAGGAIIGLIGVVDVNGVSQPASMPSLGTLTFRDPYSTAQTFSATVAKTVTPAIDDAGDDDDLPDFPADTIARYGIGILDGLLGKMMSHQNKSYTDRTQSVYHLQRFRDSITRARMDALHRNTMGVQAWAFPQSYRMHGQRGGVSVGNDTRFL